MQRIQFRFLFLITEDDRKNSNQTSGMIPDEISFLPCRYCRRWRKGWCWKDFCDIDGSAQISHHRSLIWRSYFP
nr:MAG TPA: hypothetical protein [Caudoviricetes sp.]